MDNRQANKNLLQCYKITIVLITIIVCLILSILWLLYRPEIATRQNSLYFSISSKRNIVQDAFPKVNFSKIYKNLTSGEIDQLQRECFSIRYVYAPFIQFKPLPIKKRFIEITEAGYRKGKYNQPWPPIKEDMVIFIFGGSTAFSYGLTNEESLVSLFNKQLSNVFKDRTIQCYNFGRGYYFSSQERLLFEQLLITGIVPDIAIFIDGLNDFFYADGNPQLTKALYQYTARDLKIPAPPAIDRKTTVQQILNRYKNNIKLIEAIAEKYNVTPIFVGQPVPFLHLPIAPETFPFPSTFSGHDLCQWGYGYFGQAAINSEFGNNFIWCGDAFKSATSVMYVDSIHYSREGAEIFAACILRKSLAKGLIH